MRGSYDESMPCAEQLWRTARAGQRINGDKVCAPGEAHQVGVLGMSERGGCVDRWKHFTLKQGDLRGRLDE